MAKPSEPASQSHPPHFVCGGEAPFGRLGASSPAYSAAVTLPAYLRLFFASLIARQIGDPRRERNALSTSDSHLSSRCAANPPERRLRLHPASPLQSARPAPGEARGGNEIAAMPDVLARPACARSARTPGFAHPWRHRSHPADPAWRIPMRGASLRAAGKLSFPASWTLRVRLGLRPQTPQPPTLAGGRLLIILTFYQCAFPFVAP